MENEIKKNVVYTYKQDMDGDVLTRVLTDMGGNIKFVKVGMGDWLAVKDES